MRHDLDEVDALADDAVPVAAPHPDADRTCLPFAEQLLLWAIRMTVLGLKTGAPTQHPVIVAYRKAGAPAVPERLGLMMRVLALGALRPVQIATPCAMFVTEDERALVAMIAMAQPGDAVRGTLMLRRILSPAACRATAALAGEVAALMGGAGLHLRRPRAQGRPIPPPAPLSAV